jgi:hypothetical protein
VLGVVVAAGLAPKRPPPVLLAPNILVLNCSIDVLEIVL